MSLITYYADIKSANGIIKNLVYITPNRGLMYVGIMDRDIVSPVFEHLVCFLPGTLMLGVTVLDLTAEERQLHEWAAHGLAYTCYISYADQATGLGPERLAMTPGEKWVDKVAEWRAKGSRGAPPGLLETGPQSVKEKRDYTNLDGRYLLRPEVCQLFHSYLVPYLKRLSRWCRPSRVSSTCGELRAIQNGETADMRSTKQSRSTRALNWDMRVSTTSTLLLVVKWTRCPGTLPFSMFLV